MSSLQRPHQFEAERARAGRIGQRAIAADRLGSAVKDLTRSSPRTPCAAPKTPSWTRRAGEAIADHAGAFSAAAAAFSAAAAAAATRSCAFFFGRALTGLLCASRLAMPRPSNSRSTRSVGWAPLASQPWPSRRRAPGGWRRPWPSADRKCRSSRRSGRRAACARRRRRCDRWPLLGAAADRRIFRDICGFLSISLRCVQILIASFPSTAESIFISSSRRTG